MVAQRDGLGLAQAELRARRANAVSAFERNVWTLLLEDGDVDPAAIASDVTAGDDPTPDWNRAALALLSADRALATETAGAALGNVDRYVPGYRDFVGALLGLTAGDEPAATSHATRLDAFAATHDKLRSGQPATVAAIPRGLLERDPQAVRDGVDALLTWHARRARARSEIFNSARAMVCVDAVAALVLAHERGITVDVAAAHRAATVPLLVVLVEEWDGKPVSRDTQMRLTADLVAGPLLRRVGVPIEPSPRRQVVGKQQQRPKSRARPTDAPAEAAIDAVRQRFEHGRGTPWQLASWALMIGDVEHGRRALRAGAVAARQLWMSVDPPNHNHVREHLALALVTGDEGAVTETGAALDAWMRSVETSQQRYAHANGYLDLVSHVVTGRAAPTREHALVVGELLPGTRVAGTGLVERDASLFAEGIDTMLADHAHALERRTSPPPAVCEPVACLLVAGRRVGLRPEIADGYRRHPVPVDIVAASGGARTTGRLDADLTRTFQ